MTGAYTPHDTGSLNPQGVALRDRLETLVDWLRLELEKRQIDAETTYDHAAKLLGVVGEMRFLDPCALQRPETIMTTGEIQ